MYYYTGDPIKLLNYLHNFLQYFGNKSELLEKDSEDIIVRCNSFNHTHKWVYSISQCVFNSELHDFIRSIKISRYDGKGKEFISNIYLDRFPSVGKYIVIDEKDWMKLVLFFMIPSVEYTSILKFYGLEDYTDAGVGRHHNLGYKDSDHLIRHIKLSMTGI